MPRLRTSEWIALAAVAVTGVVVVSWARRRSNTLYPSGAGRLPYLPDLPPPPVSGYDEDEIYFDPNDPPPSEDEYDDRLPCATQAQLSLAISFGEDAAGCLLPSAIEPKDRTPVPYAGIPSSAPMWPVRVGRQREVRVSYQDQRGKWHGRWGRHFAAGRKRKDGTGGRYHAGIDLSGEVGDVVVAAESGTVEAILPFTAGTWAIYVRSDDGTLLNYGEVERGSWREYGTATGNRVSEGDPLALVGSQSGGGAHMLHFEIYRPDVTIAQIRQGKMQWPLESPPPAQLLDPTRYLLAAQERWIADHPEIV